MTDLIKILEEHCSVFRERGYTEIGLGTEDEPGWFVKQLEETFSYHLKESVFKKSIRSFELRAVGFFNGEQNMIAFMFHYELDPGRKKIDLKSMKADMEGVTREFQFKHGLYELPHANKLVSLLSKKQEHENNEPILLAQLIDENRLHLVCHKTLVDHQTLLATKGYTDKAHFPYHNNFLFKKLEARLIKRFTDQSQHQDFIIRTKGFFDNGNEEISFNFFYTVDHSKKELLLNSLSADHREKRIVHSLEELNDLPSAVDIWNQFNKGQKESKSKVVYPIAQVKLLLREQEDFLATIGYYKTLFSNDSNFIERELQSILQNKLYETGPQYIPITRAIHLNLHGSMHCIFYYSFDPVRVKLQLESLTAKVGGAEKKYFPTEHAAITLQSIFQELSQVSRLQQARSVVKRMTPVETRISYRKGL